MILNDTEDFLVAISSRADGNMAYEYADEASVNEHRERFFRGLHIPPLSMCEIKIAHSCNVALVSQFLPGEFMVAKYTREPKVHSDIKGFYTGFDGCVAFDDTFVSLLTADCIPLILWDSKSSLHGIVHVGLLGALNGIVLNLSEIFKRYGIDPAVVNYYIGPGITRQHYNVSKSNLWLKIRAQALQVCPNIGDYLLMTQEGEFLDVPGMLLSQMQEIGACETRIRAYSGCTAAADSPFFSHYVATQNHITNARFISVIGPRSALETE